MGIPTSWPIRKKILIPKPLPRRSSRIRIPGGLLFKMKVVHCKKDPYDVYIGRPSKWGNPFTHLEDSTQAKFKVESRKEAIDAFKEWITKGEGQYLLKDLGELKGKTLGCWCKPQACHGDVLLELANKTSQELF